jgi:protein-disulfide isomerase
MKNERDISQSHKWEWWFLALAILCFAYGLFVVISQDKKSSTLILSDIPSVVLKNSVLAHGGVDAPWKVVEFMDYECPPCKAMDITAQQIVNQSRGQLSWKISGLPLPMHNSAPELNIIAMVGKERAVFQKIHTFLLENQTKPYFWKEEKSSVLLNISRDALKNRIDDQADRIAHGALAKGDLIGIEGTPAVFLISPDSKVWIVRDPKEILSFIRANTKV